MSGPQEVEFQAVEAVAWMLGVQLRSAGRAASTLDGWAFSPAPAPF